MKRDHDEQRILLDGISWATYQNLLYDQSDRNTRLTYDHGKLEITRTNQTHEQWKWRFRSLINFASLERQIEVNGIGSTTLFRKDLAVGLEPDQCFYVAHADAVRGHKDLDLSVDPPPDLAIEIETIHRSILRLPILGAFGIPEVWHFNGVDLNVLTLDHNHKYALVENSGVFPGTRMRDLQKFVIRLAEDPWLMVMKDFRAYLQSIM